MDDQEISEVVSILTDTKILAEVQYASINRASKILSNEIDEKNDPLGASIVNLRTSEIGAETSRIKYHCDSLLRRISPDHNSFITLQQRTKINLETPVGNALVVAFLLKIAAEFMMDADALGLSKSEMKNLDGLFVDVANSFNAKRG